MIRKLLFLPLLGLLISTGACAKIPPVDSEKQRFVDEMSSKHGFDPHELGRLLARAEYRQSIIDAMERPAEAKPWRDYRPIFVTDSRTEQGLDFWRENEVLLQKVERQYGVPPEIIVAIIGVETRYGRHTGRYPVLDALTTLAFGYPKRSRFFRQELEHFLLLSREEKLQPLKPKGSYAGAMGKPQFIASSYRRYAVDFDGNGVRDLWNSNADIIGSVANYFKRHGWRPGEPITLPARGAGEQHQAFVDAGMKPSISLASLFNSGITAEVGLQDDAKSSLIRLEGEKGDEYWLGLHNFYVITRYNHSNLYAMAVYQLSQRILEQRNNH